MPDLTQVSLHEALVVVVPALLIIGFALKQTPKCPDWLIVWALLVLGAVAGIVAIGANLEGVANGLIAGGLAITANQVYKQTVAKRKADEEI
jgi:hypothetical protein